jgi:superfamily II DNA or RNA helicase
MKRDPSYDRLLEKYQRVVIENQRLNKEIKALKARLGIDAPTPAEHKSLPQDNDPESGTLQTDLSDAPGGVTNRSDSMEKIRLFRSLFRGREDVYAKRWENRKKGTSGYSPFCENEWKTGICPKPRGPCATCSHKAYAPLTEAVIDDHLRGNIIAGIYPMGLDDTCWFLAIDFDGGEWQKDISVLREVCTEFDIPVAIERSRSGAGAHAWFFFERQLPAILARSLGSSLITHAMNKRHDITFKSYDRFFPNQDTLPKKGGLGNLIALPLQKAARRDHNSEFIDGNFVSYKDQWAFLSTVRKLSEEAVQGFIARLTHGRELGILRPDETEERQDFPKPWERVPIQLAKSDFPSEIEIVRANMLFVAKTGFSQRALNRLKRLAAFKNPEFYKAQAMRHPTWNKPRIISCADETAGYLALPRGCDVDLKALFAEFGVAVNEIDKTNPGRSIDVEFLGALRDEQPLAIDRLLEHDMGVLSATTAFGKTVVAIRLIAERGVNTLVVVNRITLVSQWKKRLKQFLAVHETLPEHSAEGVKKRGRKKKRSIIGQLGGGKETLGGIIDIALMQSISRAGEVHPCVKNYGMVIVDECHHVAALSLDTILRQADAKYIYGLTATPKRKDGHHPIIFMQCGPIRYQDDARAQAAKRPFEHFVIPRFTTYRVPMERDEGEVSIQEHYGNIATDEMRNQLIIDDIVKSHENGRNCLVLTERTAHVALLARMLAERVPGVMSLTGGMGTRETGEILKKLYDSPADRQLTIVATGRYIGEGFDEPRLDTLFLTMPISWKGTLQQYAGRLHRLFENKNEVHIYDYVDVHVRMLERMYHRRLTGYAAIGYKAKGELTIPDSIDIIFDKTNFLPVYENDILAAEKEILIVSPFVTRRRTVQMLPPLEAALQNQVQISVVTRRVEDFGAKDTSSLQGTLEMLEGTGVHLICRSQIHQKFAVIDQRIVWYGSINLLSFGGAQESIMRLESPNIARELIRTLEQSDQ